MTTYKIDRQVLSTVNLAEVNNAQAGLMKAMFLMTKAEPSRLISEVEIIDFAIENNLLETESADYRKSFATHKSRCFKKYKFMIKVGSSKNNNKRVVAENYLKDEEEAE